MSFANVIKKDKWIRDEVQVLASTSNIVDEIDLDDFSLIEYYISVKKNDFTESMSLKLTVRRVNSDIEHIVGSKMTTGLDVEINPSVSLGLMSLEVVNNESFNLDVNFARLLI